MKPGYELVVPDVLDSFGMSLLDITFNKQASVVATNCHPPAS